MQQKQCRAFGRVTAVPEICSLSPCYSAPQVVLRLRSLRDGGTDLAFCRRVAIHEIARLHDVRERQHVVELLGHSPLGALLFVDDVVASFASEVTVCHAGAYENCYHVVLQCPRCAAS